MKLLVLGGARSGKSAYAEQQGEERSGELIYIATAEPRDTEMDARVCLHRERRGPRWKTREEPLELLKLLREVAHAESFVLVDCLTLWLSNLMFAERDIDLETQVLAKHVPELPGRICFVSNEVGQGIVPDNKLARDFRDHAGRMNQALAVACNRVVFVTAGLPQILKG